jgi:hypothetical protein
VLFYPLYLLYFLNKNQEEEKERKSSDEVPNNQEFDPEN